MNWPADSRYLLQKSGEGDLLRTVAETVLQILMEADVEGLIGAGKHERSTDRLTELTPPAIDAVPAKLPPQAA